MPAIEDARHPYSPEERPTFPGSPGVPARTPASRALNAAIAIALGIGATFGNALVNVNAGALGGAMGLYAAEVSWLPAIFVAMVASANLVLVKARAQWGIPAVSHALLWGYAVIGLWQLLHPGFTAAIAMRAACGLAAAGLITLTIYYLMQVFPGKLRPLALVVGLGLVQLGTPLARLVPVEMLALQGWRGLCLIEIAVALGLLALITAYPLPPGERSRAFEARDVLTIALLVPVYVLFCGVLGQGRIQWWTDAPWMGPALLTAVVLLTVAVFHEMRRERPLLQLGWLGMRDILRFALVALFLRLTLAEQTYAAVGLLTSGGLNNDQLHSLFIIVAIAMVLGIVCAVLTLSERRLPYQVATAALLISWAAWMDGGASNLTRPEQLYFSQALIGFGTTLFIGPALLYGFIRMFSQGADHLVTFIVLFSTTQNVGGLAGSALLGSAQIISTRLHSTSLAESALATDPAVASRMTSGATSLGRALAREANVLAYDDVFRWLSVAGVMVAVYVLIVAIAKDWRRWRKTPLGGVA